MRRHRLLLKSQAWPKDQTEDQGAPAGSHVNDSATGKINRFNTGSGIPDSIHKPGNSPDHVGHGEIHKEHPEPNKDQYGGVFHPLSDRTDNESWRNDRKHQLIHGVDVLRHPI